MNLKSFLCSLGPTFFLLIHLVSAAPEVRLSVGIVRGSDDGITSAGVTFVYAYYGIPFAQPPVKELRFRAPEPFIGKGPTEVISSNTFRHSCWQAAAAPGVILPPMSEDCLFLNVFTPSTASKSSPKKVMVWIHEGGFETGDTRPFNSTSLVVNSDVIVVTIQYRLALLGFLSSGDDVLPGNLGLRDQIMALKWVKNYISEFGGDPDDVTVFGVSAGAVSGSILSLSPAAKGLFTKVIMQSGSVLTPWAIYENQTEQFYDIARQMNCIPQYVFRIFRRKFNPSILNCLMNVEEGTEEFQRMVNFQQAATFTPVVDGDLIPRDPYSLLADEEYLEDVGALNISYVIGVTNNEGGMLAALTNAVALTDPVAAADLIHSSANSFFPHPVDDNALNVPGFIYTYPRESEDRVPFQKVLDLYSDVNYVVPSLLVARLLAEKSEETPIYVYQFDYNPPLTNPNGEVKGIVHGYDIAYQFDYNLAFFYFVGLYLPEDPNRDTVRKEFGGALAEFAKSGRPSSKNIVWPRYNSSQQLYTSISQKPSIRESMYAQRISLWAEFLPSILQMPPNGRGSGVPFWPF